MDAAIADSAGKDFQIRNNKNYPIYIEGYCTGAKVYFNIYGKEERESTHKVEYESEIKEVAVQNTVWVTDPTLPLGVMKQRTAGHTGYIACLWKIIYENGEEVSRKVYNNSRYAPSDRTVAIGTATDNPAAAAAMEAAVSTQDAGTIANAVATIAPGVENRVPFTITPQYRVTAEVEAEKAAAEAAAEAARNGEVSPEAPAQAVDETTGEAI